MKTIISICIVILFSSLSGCVSPQAKTTERLYEEASYGRTKEPGEYDYLKHYAGRLPGNK